MEEWFSHLKGHDAIRRVLASAAVRPANAYGFFGPRGVGKRTFAEAFIRALLNWPGERSLSSHPDLQILEKAEDKREIGVKEVRELLARAHLSSALGGRRVILIDHAHELTGEATNALLKDVEEPGSDLVFIFISPYPGLLLPTLRSRLVPLTFQVLPGSSASYDERWRDLAEAMCRAFEQTSPGALIARLDELFKKKEDTPDEWRRFLEVMVHVWQTREWDSREKRVSAGKAIAFAQELIGSGVSPRVGLEWGLLHESLPTDEQLRDLALRF